jgi:hypothetical protein
VLIRAVLFECQRKADRQPKRRPHGRPMRHHDEASALIVVPIIAVSAFMTFLYQQPPCTIDSICRRTNVF